jgi:hypothetical protein
MNMYVNVRSNVRSTAGSVQRGKLGLFEFHATQYEIRHYNRGRYNNGEVCEHIITSFCIVRSSV